MVYGLWRALPGAPGFLATVACAPSRRLDTSVGVSGPHAFSVRFSAIRQRHIRVHCIPPRVSDDRETPLSLGRDGERLRLIWAERKQNFRISENIFRISECFVVAGCTRRPLAPIG